MNVWPVFVHSKGRPQGHTFTALGDVPYEVIVEPGEAEAYSSHRTIVLPENGRGLAYSRQFGLQTAQAREWPWYWLLDDDVKSFKRRDGNKMVSCTAEEALIHAQRYAADRVAQIALEYSQYAWSATAPRFNSYADVVVANHAALLANMQYDVSFVLKGDRDFTIQCIARHMTVVRDTDYGFVCPKNGSNAGGLFGTYSQENVERDGSARLAQKWPWCVTTQTKPDGRQDAKVHWRRIR